jgi:hypothetical protein
MSPEPDKKEMPVSGGGASKGKPDGVSGSPDTAESGLVHGRSPSGESGGGSYPNPHSDKGQASSSFSGGQGDKAYYGGDNPNATTRPRKDQEDEGIGRGSDTSPRESHAVQANDRTIEVVEDSGVAAAEATGKIATDAPYEAEQESPAGG